MLDQPAVQERRIARADEARLAAGGPEPVADPANRSLILYFVAHSVTVMAGSSVRGRPRPRSRRNAVAAWRRRAQSGAGRRSAAMPWVCPFASSCRRPDDGCPPVPLPGGSIVGIVRRRSLLEPRPELAQSMGQAPPSKTALVMAQAGPTRSGASRVDPTPTSGRHRRTPSHVSHSRRLRPVPPSTPWAHTGRCSCTIASASRPRQGVRGRRGGAGACGEPAASDETAWGRSDRASATYRDGEPSASGRYPRPGGVDDGLGQPDDVMTSPGSPW